MFKNIEAKEIRNLDSYLPQSEKEWLESGTFTIENVAIGEKSIRCAFAEGSEGNSLVTMVGGIPRDPERRKNLPLINKLYGHLAIKLAAVRESSVMYNQPATGGSGGDWDKETLQTRARVLAGVSEHFCEKVKPKQVAIVGTSAGAYMAAKSILELQESGINVSKLVLLSPAAYPESIDDIPYGEKFSEIVRTPWNVSDSPIFSILQRFTESGGSVLISFFEDDDPPIPKQIQEYYRNFVKELSDAGGKIKIITIPGVAHNFRRIGSQESKNVVDNDSVRSAAGIFFSFLSQEHNE